MARTWYKKGPLRIGVDRESRHPLKVEFDEYAWPKKARHKLEYDEQGLPVFCWRDPNSWLPRAVFVLPGKDDDPRSTLLFHVNGNYDGRCGQLRWIMGLSLAILGLFIFMPVWNSYFFTTYTDVRNAPFSLDTAPMIVNGIYDVVVGYGFWPVGAGMSMTLGYLLGLYLAINTTKRMVWNGINVEISFRKWIDLASFSIEDSMEIYGSLREVEPLADEKARRLIIRGHFGTEDFPVEVSRSTFNAASVQALHQILTREFIQKRQAYLDKLPPAPARSKVNGIVGASGRDWSGDIPDRL